MLLLFYTPVIYFWVKIETPIFGVIPDTPRAFYLIMHKLAPLVRVFIQYQTKISRLLSYTYESIFARLVYKYRNLIHIIINDQCHCCYLSRQNFVFKRAKWPCAVDELRWRLLHTFIILVILVRVFNIFVLL